MIYVIEIPHQMPPRAWCANSREDFVDAVADSARLHRSGTVILEQSTPRHLLDEYGVDSFDEARKEEPWIAELADRHGPDTMLYRSNFGEYQASPIDKFTAYKDFLASDLNSLMVFENEESALQALDNATVWDIHGGAQARQALSRQIASATA